MTPQTRTERDPAITGQPRDANDKGLEKQQAELVAEPGSPEGLADDERTAARQKGPADQGGSCCCGCG